MLIPLAPESLEFADIIFAINSFELTPAF